jgi:hypothetical protein
MVRQVATSIVDRRTYQVFDILFVGYHGYSLTPIAS